MNAKHRKSRRELMDTIREVLNKFRTWDGQGRPPNIWELIGNRCDDRRFATFAENCAWDIAQKLLEERRLCRGTKIGFLSFPGDSLCHLCGKPFEKHCGCPHCGELGFVRLAIRRVGLLGSLVDIPTDEVRCVGCQRTYRWPMTIGGVGNDDRLPNRGALKRVHP